MIAFSEENGNKIQPNPNNPVMVRQHRATFGKEFYVSSGVYRIIRNYGKWEPQMIAPILEYKYHTLSNIVDLLESKFGAGRIFCM